jgi:hypothetical protein
VLIGNSMEFEEYLDYIDEYGPIRGLFMHKVDKLIEQHGNLEEASQNEPFLKEFASIAEEYQIDFGHFVGGYLADSDSGR